MSKTLTVQVSDTTFAILEAQARDAGQAPAELAACALEQRFNGVSGLRQTKKPLTEAEKQAARERFERHFGAVSVPDPTGVWRQPRGELMLLDTSGLLCLHNQA
jgi:hypothetical protein